MVILSHLVNNLAIKIGKKRRRSSHRDEQNHHFKNKIKLGESKWKFSNFRDQNENNPNIGKKCNFNLKKNPLNSNHNWYRKKKVNVRKELFNIVICFLQITRNDLFSPVMSSPLWWVRKSILNRCFTFSPDFYILSIYFYKYIFQQTIIHI